MRLATTRKSLVPTEYAECLLLVEYLDLLKRMGKVILYTHIPNETFTKSWNIKRKNKAQGVEKGFPDYCCITVKTMIFIEMKRVKGGVVSAEQKEWVEEINKVGIPAKVCKGFEEAKQFLDQYL